MRMARVHVIIAPTSGWDIGVNVRIIRTVATVNTVGTAIELARSPQSCRCCLGYITSNGQIVCAVGPAVTNAITACECWRVIANTTGERTSVGVDA
jgi:hypothetical protein